MAVAVEVEVEDGSGHGARWRRAVMIDSGSKKMDVVDLFYFF